MGTCNFHSMTNFDLWAVGSDRFYSKLCPACHCGGMYGDTCECCGADLSDVAEEYDDVAELIFYEDILADLEEVNAGLLFHEITIQSGYYEGLQLYVTLNHAADNAGRGDSLFQCHGKASFVRKLKIISGRQTAFPVPRA